MKLYRILFLVCGLFSIIKGETCEKPKVQASQYTPSDSQILTHVPFIAEFTLACSNGAANVPLYAYVDGAIAPVVKSKDGSKYQVSWTTELKKAKAGDFEVHLYDEDGYGAVKRVIDRGEDLAAVKPLVTVVVSFPGAYSGPWLNSELMATLLSITVFYMAFTAKNSLLA